MIQNVNNQFTKEVQSINEKVSVINPGDYKSHQKYGQQNWSMWGQYLKTRRQWCLQRLAIQRHHKNKKTWKMDPITARRNNIRISGIREKSEDKKMTLKNLLMEIMAENFSNIGKEIDTKARDIEPQVAIPKKEPLHVTVYLHIRNPAQGWNLKKNF